MTLIPEVGRKQMHVKTAITVIAILLWMGVLLHLFPFWFMFISSLKTGAEIFKTPPTLWPQEPTLAAWKLLFMIDQIGSKFMAHPLVYYFWNSVKIAFFTLALSIPITSMAAYANSKLQKGRSARWWFLFFTGTMMIPAAVTLIPRYLMVRNFPVPFPISDAGAIPASRGIFGLKWLLFPGTELPLFPQLLDNPLGVILPAVFYSFNFLMFKGFFDSIPDSIIQAARVDGGTEWNIFRKIVLPMSVPVYAVAIWVQFLGVFEAYQWPSLVLTKEVEATMVIMIQKLSTMFLSATGTTNANAANAISAATRELLQKGFSWNGLMVLAILQSLPGFIVFIATREFLTKGIKIRGMK